MWPKSTGKKGEGAAYVLPVADWQSMGDAGLGFDLETLLGGYPGRSQCHVWSDVVWWFYGWGRRVPPSFVGLFTAWILPHWSVPYISVVGRGKTDTRTCSVLVKDEDLMVASLFVSCMQGLLKACLLCTCVCMYVCAPVHSFVGAKDCC